MMTFRVGLTTRSCAFFRVAACWPSRRCRHGTGQAAELHECVESFVGDEDDISALAAVAAVGTALGDVLGASERDAAVATSAGLNDDFDVIDEHVKAYACGLE